MEGDDVPFDPTKSFRGIELIAVNDVSSRSGAVDTTAQGNSKGGNTSSPEYQCQEQAVPHVSAHLSIRLGPVDSQDAMAHDTGQDATGRIDE